MKKKSASKMNGKVKNGTGKITAEDDVMPYVSKLKLFTTDDVVSHFGITQGSATALVAVMRIKRVIESAGKRDGVSLWRYIG